MTAPQQSHLIRDLFDDLESAEIHKWIVERRQEDLNLDCKLAPKNLESRDERKTLAEACSGFLNSSGGLIVWGEVAKKDSATGVDCALSAEPLTDPELLLNNLIRYGEPGASKKLSRSWTDL
jgi:hypothetical protein